MQSQRSKATQCQVNAEDIIGCSRKWDTFLCWPQSEADSLVAIPCNISDPFVSIVLETRPGLSKDQIPGRYIHKTTIVIFSYYYLLLRERRCFYQTMTVATTKVSSDYNCIRCYI